MTHFKGILTAGSLCLAALTLTAAPAQADLLAYWSFDNAGNPYHDDSGNGNDGTAYGNPAQATGKVGAGSLSLDGSSAVNINTTLGSNLTNFTVSAWCLTDAAQTSARYVVGKFAHANSSGFKLYYYSSTNRGYAAVMGGPGNYNSHLIGTGNTPVGDNGEWHHVALTYDSGNDGDSSTGTGRFYVDGVLAATTTDLGFGNDVTDMFAIGMETAPASANFWNGDVDEVALWNSTLTGDQIADLADGTTTPLTLGTVPEPASLALLALGGMTLLGRRRQA